MNYDFEVAARARAALSQLGSSNSSDYISATKFSAGQNYQRKVFKCRTHTHNISTCVWVCACASYIIHDASPALEPMSCDRRSSTGIHNDACQLPSQFIALAYGCARPSIRLGIDSEPGLSDHSESPLLSPSLSSSIHNVQQVHLNIQFQLAIPVPDLSFPSLFSSTSSAVFSFCFFKRINTRARTKNA